MVAGNSVLHLHSFDDFMGLFRSVVRHLSVNGRLIFDAFVPNIAMLSRVPGQRYFVDVGTTIGEGDWVYNAPMDTWALARNVRVKHLAIYLVVAFVIDRRLAYMDGLLLRWDIGRAIEISMIVAFGWLIVGLFVEIRQG